MRSLQAATALFVSAFALPALALSLGQPQGSAWIGKPLDLRIPLVLDPGQAAGSLCPQVELRQGETAQSEGRVSAVVEPGPEADSPRLRIRSSRSVDEPVLHLRVMVGCQGSTAREFVLLADPPPVLTALPEPAPERAQLASARVEPAAAAAAPVRRRVRSTPGGEGRTTSARAPRQAPAAAGAVPTAARTAASRPVGGASVAAAAAPTGGARLQLDPLEPLPARETPPVESRSPVVPLAGVAGAGAASAASTGADASATTAAPAPSQGDTLAQAQRTAQMEAALAQLREQARQNQQTLEALRTELAEARDGRYSNPLVYLLLLLLLAAAVALWRLARRTPESPWAVPVEADGDARPPGPARRMHGAQDEDDEADERAGEGRVYFPAVAHGAAGAEPDGDEDQTPGRVAAAPGKPRVSVWDTAPQPEVLGAQARSASAEALFDVQQQAEFFMSLGQHDKAIETLTHYVGEHHEASTLAYLELLHIYHQLQREDDYERLREQCQSALKVHVPAFRDFGANGGRTLAQYPETLARLQAHWPHAQTLEVIEDLLFQRGAPGGGEVFDLAAYRELLMLYALVQEQQFDDTDEWPALSELLRLSRAEAGAAPAAQRAGDTRAAPLVDRFDGVLDPQRGDFEPTWPPHLDLDLDIDLDRLRAHSVETTPLALQRRAGAAQPLPAAAPAGTETALQPPSAVLRR